MGNICKYVETSGKIWKINDLHELARPGCALLASGDNLDRRFAGRAERCDAQILRIAGNMDGRVATARREQVGEKHTDDSFVYFGLLLFIPLWRRQIVYLSHCGTILPQI